MKKAFAVFLIVIAALCFAACGTQELTEAEGDVVYRESTVSDEIALTFRNENGDILMDNADVAKIYARHNDKHGYFIEIEFTEEGTAKFASVTEEYIGKVIKLCVDDTVLMKPTVSAAITDGHVVVSGPSKEALLEMFDRIAK